jgi:hypothetical protein
VVLLKDGSKLFVGSTGTGAPDEIEKGGQQGAGGAAPRPE